ncbi:hypothetical protein G7054_g7514 [Neopestalotiopsis clavispora]|nr:hypothetical protein G7054_g7514 [Neopestalotiopsis clavispora]
MSSAPVENTEVPPASQEVQKTNEEEEEVNPEPQEAKMPTRKDVSLKEFLNKMDDYAPIIPDAVTNFYLAKAGLPPPPQTDQRLARLLALATQKFVADIAADAYQYSRIRASNTSANNPMGNLGAAAGLPIPGQAQPNAKDQGRGGPWECSAPATAVVDRAAARTAPCSPWRTSAWLSASTVSM